MIALQVVRTSFGFHLREFVGSCSPFPPPSPLPGQKLFQYKKIRELKPARDAHSCHITNIEPLAP